MNESENQVVSLLKQAIAIIDQFNISDGQLMQRTNNKYSKPTIANFKHLKSLNPNMETFVDLCTAAGIRIKLETDESLKAEETKEIEEFRIKYAEKCVECENLNTKNQEMHLQFEKIVQTNAMLAENNGKLASTNGKLVDCLSANLSKNG